MINMTAGETHHIGNQSMLLVQRLVGLFIHGCMAMPAEGFQRFPDKFMRLRSRQSPLFIVNIHQRTAARRKDIALRQDLRGLAPQCRIINQFQTQQRGENAKWITLQRGIFNGAKSGGMHRNPGHRQVVIAHGLHPHNGENAA